MEADMPGDSRFRWALSPKDQLWHRVAADTADSLSESGFSFTASCLATFPSDELSDQPPDRETCPVCRDIAARG